MDHGSAKEGKGKIEGRYSKSEIRNSEEEPRMQDFVGEQCVAPVALGCGDDVDGRQDARNGKSGGKPPQSKEEKQNSKEEHPRYKTRCRDVEAK
jgi:hypothetical protein